MRYSRTALSGLLALGLASAAGLVVAGDMHGRMGKGDQKVSKEEYLKHAEARFARMDVNKDGVIDATDRAAMRKRMRECMEKTGDAHTSPEAAAGDAPQP